MNTGQHFILLALFIHQKGTTSAHLCLDTCVMCVSMLLSCTYMTWMSFTLQETMFISQMSKFTVYLKVESITLARLKATSKQTQVSTALECRTETHQTTTFAVRQYFGTRPS